MEKQNVLHLVEYLYLGGIERLLEQLALKTKDKANIHFFTYETQTLLGIGKQIRDHGFPVYTYKKSAGRDWNLVFELSRIIKEKNIQVLHTHDFGPVEYAVLLKIRFPGLKLVHTQHTVINFIRYKKYPLFFQFASYFYNCIIAVSKSNAEIIKGHCPFMKRWALKIISNGVDTDVFKPTAKNINKKQLRLVSIARISHEKNLHYLFHTCKLLKETGIPFVFHHAGTGKTPELLNTFEAFIKENHLENNVVLHGFSDNAKKILDQGDIFLSASHTEGHPIAVLEAMSCEKLCFCSDISPHRELGDSVILFNKEDATGLFNALVSFYHNSEFYNLRKKMARKTVLSRFSIQTMVQNYVKQYNS